MIEGPSGAGKSSLAMGLIEAARYHNIAHDFICDDQALLQVKDNELWALAPQPIAGKIEIHGHGISNIDFVGKAKINLVCKMVNQEKITRHPDIVFCWHLGVKIASIQVPIQHEAQSVRILLARLGIPIQESKIR